MHKATQSPVIGFKIAIVNGADLSREYKIIKPAVIDDEGNVTTPEVREQQYVQASKRLMRAIRKARAMSSRQRNIFLFGERKDGTHFPVSLKMRVLR